ncbi:bifunctional GNAT family N-acetyltransferase/PLP-dependent aspartate aminotransferase family protein [Pelagicoccus sp. SDUM812005]|uniref:bifunctional GNAT family N-acetyltransferase/PLP-dependent aspartate aminotransferase family protein n=1 Tax=Pelagicoccus sp. SDUM812005 TaxID=3041257 RepID=UPI00280E3811|nr:bifunctional GNAT family N-acetyltransferase/PLP-dependent aspartate aminotransferase family protein [Pelagicoccus sp. SDUM812005]MDQ8180933.1 bifunctional GNAT family N-acetyltransferase/PLP-dependent aspartate aminotransferase family protein [Pelagicoccus sp. SDUM812005]
MTPPLQGSKKRKVETFKSAIKEQFAFLKNADTLEQTFTRAITLNKSGGLLIPISRIHSNDTNLINKISDWRAANQFAYPTQFKVTAEGTQRWLRSNLLGTEDRILFIVYNKHNTPIGHLGFANCLNDDCSMEIDNVLRGEPGDQGIMSEAMNALIQWAQETLWPESIHLRVLSDNQHALRFYQNLGFAIDSQTPLQRIADENGHQLLPFEEKSSRSPDAFFINMLLVQKEQGKPDEKILTAGPSISQREVSFGFDALKRGWNNNWAKYLNEFEAAFANYIGVKHAIATSSCTGALHIALKALGIGPGDEVIVPDLTWVATANAVTYVGATPVFCDIETNSWCVDSDSFRSLITSKTKAIIPVHLYGHPARMDVINTIAKEHGLFVVEDAAPSIGAECAGQRTGSFGHFSAFSFQGAKLAVTGEGGMLLTNDDALYDTAASIANQGRKAGTFWIENNGLKYKMSNVQAAIGLAQLQRNEAMVEAKRRIFSWYEDELSNLPLLKLNRECEWARSIYWMTSIFLDEEAGITRDALIAELAKRNVDTRPTFPAISQYSIWKRPQSPPQKNAKRIGDQSINLPSGTSLKREQVRYICRSIKSILSSQPNA